MAISPSRQLLLQNLAKLTKELILKCTWQLAAWARVSCNLDFTIMEKAPARCPSGAFSMIVKSSRTLDSLRFKL